MIKHTVFFSSSFLFAHNKRRIRKKSRHINLFVCSEYNPSLCFEILTRRKTRKVFPWKKTKLYFLNRKRKMWNGWREVVDKVFFPSNECFYFATFLPKYVFLLSLSSTNGIQCIVSLLMRGESFHEGIWKFSCWTDWKVKWKTYFGCTLVQWNVLTDSICWKCTSFIFSRKTFSWQKPHRKHLREKVFLLIFKSPAKLN